MAPPNITIEIPPIEDITSLFYAISILQLIEAIGTLIANLLVVFMYILMKEKRYKIPNYLLLAQGITDLYNSSTIWYEVIINLSSPYEKSTHEVLLLFNNGLLEFSLALSLATLVVGSFERFLAIVTPIYHKRFVTLDRVRYGTCITWILSLIPVMLLLSLMGFSTANQNKQRVIMYSFVFDAIMCSIIVMVTIMLISTLVKAKSSWREQEKLICLKIKKEFLERHNKKRVRLTLLFLIMLITYTVTFTPIIICRILYDTNQLHSISLYDRVLLIGTCHLLYKSSAFVNPMYTLLIKDHYKQALTRFLRKTKFHLYARRSSKVRPKDVFVFDKLSSITLEKV